MSARPSPLFHLIAGFALWAVAFIALYALQALGCRYGWGAVDLGPIDLHRAVLVAAYGLVLASASVLVIYAWRRPSLGFLSDIGRYLNLAALVASAVIFAATLGVSTCV